MRFLSICLVAFYISYLFFIRSTAFQGIESTLAPDTTADAEPIQASSHPALPPMWHPYDMSPPLEQPEESHSVLVPLPHPVDKSHPAPSLSKSPAPSREWEQPEDTEFAAPTEAGLAPDNSSPNVEESPQLSGEMDEEEEMVKWCAVRDEFSDCEYFISSLKQTNGYNWKCVKRETVQECLISIKNGEADLINLEAGLAYIAFLNYSMKAIANEVYCNHAESYNAVAVVHREICEGKRAIDMKALKGLRSCHGGYSTAAGWNYPVNYLRYFVDAEKSSHHVIVTKFFSKVCAPSEFQGTGECSGCANENGSCLIGTSYQGHSGAFRCLMESLGDVAFVKDDTPLLYSMEGPLSTTWSTKSIRKFMYLCPHGGCREINGYPGDCQLGAVPANVIMSQNSISSKKRTAVLQTLLNASWAGSFINAKSSDKHLLSPSTQGLSAVKQLTRSYLGKSAVISDKIKDLGGNKIGVDQSTIKRITGIASITQAHSWHPWIISCFSIILGLL